MSTLCDAQATMHPAETQWHYALLTAYGYKCITPPQQGLVRSYTYKRLQTDREFVCTTGSSADYWRDNTGAGGYWGSLQTYLKSVSEVIDSHAVK